MYVSKMVSPCIAQIDRWKRPFLLFLLCLGLFTTLSHRPAQAASQPEIVLAIYSVITPELTNSYLAQTQNNPLLYLQSAIDSNPSIKIEMLVAGSNGFAQDGLYIEFTPNGPFTAASVSPLDMADPATLTLFIDMIQTKYPNSKIILAFEGHGSGYLPDIKDMAGSPEDWHPPGDDILSLEDPVTIGGSTSLPTLPIVSPELPGAIMSTYALGEALEAANADIDVILFNNCFNLSLELLTTIAPYADYAVGFPNYNFLTAGAIYQQALSDISPTQDMLSLSHTFAEANHTVLEQRPGHPTAGGVVNLSQMDVITGGIDLLAQSLMNALTADHTTYHTLIETALGHTQHYDTTSCGTYQDYLLNAEDSLIDLNDFTQKLLETFTGDEFGVRQAAQLLHDATKNINVYQASGQPWLNTNTFWDFSGASSFNIFFPRPYYYGADMVWDWRTPYYLDTQDANPNRISFLENTNWDEFIVAYHNGIDFQKVSLCTPTQ